jgi:hypothetical protein
MVEDPRHILPALPLGLPLKLTTPLCVLAAIESPLGEDHTGDGADETQNSDQEGVTRCLRWALPILSYRGLAAR